MSVPQVFVPTIQPTTETFQTAAALQRHQEWVSGEASSIPGILSENGFSLIGGVIDLNSSQAYVARRDDLVVVAFRGSGGSGTGQTIVNALKDARILRIAPTEITDQEGVKVHKGFYEDYLSLRSAVRSRVAEAPGVHVYSTGFSLGHSLSALCALDLVLNDGRAVTQHGMGTPRIGNDAFVELFDDKVPSLRTVFTLDPVPRVPLYTGPRHGFSHAGRLLELYASGAPVPTDKINGRLLTASEGFSHHNRDQYAAAIAGFLDLFADDASVLVDADGHGPLGASARAERSSTHLLG